MNPNHLFGITSVFCFLLPVAFIIIYRLYRHTSLIALMLYYVLTILHAFGSGTLPAAPDYNNTWEVLYSYIEIPLMLTSLLFFCPARQRQQKIHLVIGLFTAYEIVIACVFGFTPMASLYVMAPGLCIIIFYSGFLFIRQLKFTLLHGKNVGRVLMLGAVLFSYSCYFALLYFYFVLAKTDIASIYTLHLISSAMAALLMSTGLYMMRHRIKELQELKVTRRELQLFFGN